MVSKRPKAEAHHLGAGLARPLPARLTSGHQPAAEGLWRIDRLCPTTHALHHHNDVAGEDHSLGMLGYAAIPDLRLPTILTRFDPELLDQRIDNSSRLWRAGANGVLDGALHVSDISLATRNDDNDVSPPLVGSKMISATTLSCRTHPLF